MKPQLAELKPEKNYPKHPLSQTEKNIRRDTVKIRRETSGEKTSKKQRTDIAYGTRR